MVKERVLCTDKFALAYDTPDKRTEILKGVIKGVINCMIWEGDNLEQVIIVFYRMSNF